MSRSGLITGYVFKLVRESAGLSQESLAGTLSVDPGTVQGWETGRRPFTSVTIGRASGIRHHMLRLGADPWLLAALDDATEADYLLGEIMAGDCRAAGHPLGHLVLTHRLSDLVAWAVTGVTPTTFAVRPAGTRRGPVAAGPVLDAGEKTAFFTGLRTAAERSAGREDAVLLHRQACYLAGMNPTLGTWLGTVATTSGYFVKPQQWSPQWADARSVATALARQGDPEPLRAFIRHNTDDTTELAALNYSAYWVGELDRQHGDEFMVSTDARWRGGQLLRHIVDRLTPGHGYLDLNIHTLWTLLTARRGLVLDDPGTGHQLARRGADLLDEHDAISDQSRQELTSVLYGLRVDGVTA